MDGDSPAPTTEQTTTEPPKRGLSLLAKEIYGDNFHGETPDPAPEVQEQPEGEEHAAPEAEENAGEQEVSTSEEESPSEQETQEELISSFAELVEQNEWDWEWVKTLKVPVNVDGATTEATFSDLVKSFRGVEAANKKVEEAKAKAKAIQDEAAAKSQKTQETFAVAAKLVGKLESALIADIKSADLEGLRESDPAEYSAKKLEFAERRDAIEQMKREAYDEFQKSTQVRQQEIENEREARLPEEKAALLEKAPEWRDPDRARAYTQKVAEHLLTQGFTIEDIKAVSYDHRLLLMVYKSIKYDEQQANTSAVRKKLAKVPKVLKPGSPKPESQRTQERLGKVVAEHKQRGTVDSAYALLKAKRGGARQ